MQISQGKVCKLILSYHKITDPQTIEYEKVFCTAFSNTTQKRHYQNRQTFLDTLQIPKLSDDECLLYKGGVTETELYDALKNMPNNKSPGKDGLTKRFFSVFLG